MKPSSRGDQEIWQSQALRFLQQPVRESRRHCGVHSGGQGGQIVDAKTGQDLTRVTLTQIITEDAKEKPTGLPLELLRQLIVASDEVRQEFVMWYLKSAFDTYQKVQDAVQSRLGEVQSAILSPVDMMKQFLGAPGPSAPSRSRAGSRCPAQASSGTGGAAGERPARENKTS